MQLAEYLTALRAWCKAMSSWSMKTLRAPSRHCRDARGYGHTTKGMHDIEYTPPSRSPPPLEPSPPFMLALPSSSVLKMCPEYVPGTRYKRNFAFSSHPLFLFVWKINERLLDAWEGRNGVDGRPPVLSLMGSLVADESFKSRKFLEGWISK